MRTPHPPITFRTTNDPHQETTLHIIAHAPTGHEDAGQYGREYGKAVITLWEEFSTEMLDPSMSDTSTVHYIAALDVHHPYQHRGIGTALVDYIADTYAHIHPCVAASTYDSDGFWRRTGWVPQRDDMTGNTVYIAD